VRWANASPDQLSEINQVLLTEAGDYVAPQAVTQESNECFQSRQKINSCFPDDPLTLEAHKKVQNRTRAPRK